MYGHINICITYSIFIKYLVEYKSKQEEVGDAEKEADRV